MELHTLITKQTRKTKKLFKDLQKQKIQTAYLENLRSEILNPQKPFREYTKPPGANLVNLLEIFIESKDKPPELTKDQDKVHDQIFSFYNKLFAHKECNSNLDDIRSF